MISVFNTLPVTGVITAAVTVVVTRVATSAAETVNEIIWIMDASGY